MLKTTKYASLVIVIVSIIISCSSKTEIPNNFNKVDLLMESAIADSVFPAAVLLFGRNNQVLYNKAFGHFTYDKDSKIVTTNSMFDLASVSKVVSTTSAAMILVSEGKLNIDEKVITYLPEFNNNGKENITIRNLLLHNSGLAAFKQYYDQYSSAEEVINDIMNLGLDNPCGEKYVYSDLGMITLQKVIERIADKPLDIFIHDKLFKKLGMDFTMYNPSDDDRKNCVPTELDDFWRMRLLQGEVHDERAYLLNGVAGHAGLFSTTTDLSKFVQLLLNKGNYGGEQIINSDIVEEWTTKQSEQSDRALGWDTKSVIGYSSAGQYFSKNSFGHTGYTGTSIWVDKESKLFVILLTNRVHPTRANSKISKFRPLIHDAIFEAVFRN